MKRIAFNPIQVIPDAVSKKGLGGMRVPSPT
jgi:hypothetical protein